MIAATTVEAAPTATTVEATAAMTGERAVLWTAEHILTMPRGMVVMEYDSNEIEPVLTFVAWRRLAVVSKALYGHFLRRVVPTFLEQMRRHIHDYVSMFALGRAKGDAIRHFLPTGTVVTGSLITRCMENACRRVDMVDLWRRVDTPVDPDARFLGTSKLTGASIYRLSHACGCALDLDVLGVDADVLAVVKRHRYWAYMVTGEHTGRLVMHGSYDPWE